MLSQAANDRVLAWPYQVHETWPCGSLQSPRFGGGLGWLLQIPIRASFTY